MRSIWKQAWTATVLHTVLLGSAALGQTRGAWVDPPADLIALPAQAAELRPSVEGPLPQARTASAPAIARPSSEAGPRSSLSAVQPKTKGEAERLSLERSGQQGQAAPLQIVPRQRNSHPASEPAIAPIDSSRVAARPGLIKGRSSSQQQAAQRLATSYLNLWSASNRQTLQTTQKFYSSRILFHGKRMSFRELLAEKRRFAQRWPDRDYRYRPDTMNVRCRADTDTCNVRSTFEFEAANLKLGHRSRGVGAHELTVSFAGGRPVIIHETSRVLSRKIRR
jgi:hypothetical protein